VPEDWIEKWFCRFRGHGREIVIENEYTNRDYVHSVETFKRLLVASVNTNQNFYSSVQHFRDYGVISGLDKVYFDFDCKNNISYAVNDAYTLLSKIEDNWGIKGLVVKSGHKGAHLYYWLPEKLMTGLCETVTDYYYLKKVLNHIICELTKEKEIRDLCKTFSTMDRRVITEVRRVSRVPYSRHKTTGARVEPFNPDLLYVRENYLVPMEICVSAVEKATIDLEKKIIDDASRPVTESNMRHWRIRSCLKNAMEDSHPPHEARRAFVFDAFYAGWTRSQLIEFFKQFTDYKEGITEYQVNYNVDVAEEQKIKPFSCETLKSNGICDNSCKLQKRKWWE